MFSETINNVSASAVAKSTLLKKSKGKYLVASILAGLYVGLGIILIFNVGGTLSAAESPFTKILMGASFGIALSLVVMAGSELFTGNNLIMTIGSLEKKVTWKETINVWIFSYIGNFIGSILLAIVVVFSGAVSNASVADFFVKVSAAKMNAPFMDLLLKGVLCNILVCLAIWCGFKLKSESGKLIMIFWCLFAFITAGFEHSIANMTILGVGLFLPHSETVSLMGLANNLIPVTIGNMIGGAICIGVSYWYISKEK
ncbi:formate/nitrite transporter family protein [Clostridium grantii]|uniref:Hydrosulfide channel, FNT family n=1 Tax=Clostridium grantii DSM 8605 TaxID=1121316 RepID=A0A1M5QM76_9CLOT|nr:formate/nitrite transporter family protein [Clostridium grantii]SHH14909.1 hydrosulfide channel, FNT family [Clostridium grantii DSM 8605]